MPRFLAALSILFLPSVAFGQVIDETRWVPNGPVNAVARHEGITYVGGNFTMVSPPSGAGVTANLANGLVPAGYPQVVGRIFAAIADGSGGWIIGGEFTSVGGQPRNNIARINGDFTVNAWNPNANGPVLALSLSFVGTVYAGGSFTSIGGQARSRLAELDLTTANATTMVVTPSSTVRALAYTNNNIFVGGEFTSVNGSARNHACAVSVTTRALLAWNPNVNGPIYAVVGAVRPGPVIKVLLGGAFSQVAGQPRANLAEVEPTVGTLSTYNPSPNGTVRALDNRSGIDYVGGDFTTLAGFGRNHLGAVDGVTGQATAWNPNVDGTVEALAWTNSGFYYAGGTFENVGGAAHRNAAKIDLSTGVAAAWDPGPNNTVHAIALGSTQAYVGGEFTGLGGVARKNLYAFDDWSHGVTAWDPQADGPVAALALRAFGPVVYAVYAGGNFTHLQGQARSNLAALNPKTGVPTAWITNTDLPVSSLAVNDTMVVFGGQITTTDGQPTIGVAAKLHTGGPVIQFTGGLSPGTYVFALALSSSMLHVGTSIGFYRFELATHAVAGVLTPNTSNTAVRALYAKGNTVYAGGDFTTVDGNLRNHLVRITNNVVDAWNPGADGIVRALAQGESGLLVGGDFLNVGGAVPRARLAQIDQATGAVLPWVADVADREVFALSARGPQVDLGGTFHGIAASPAAGYAVVGPGFPALCGAPLSTFAGGRPRALAVLDANADGKEDIAVIQDGGAIPHVNIMRGNGAGLFSLAQTLDFGMSPMTVTTADFDKDGAPDLAVSENDETGDIRLFRNVAGTFQPWTVVPLMGRVDGIAAGDFDQDGIVDLAACLIDSASTIKRGGLEFFRGGGTNGTWDGTFAYTDKSHQLVWAASARRVIAHDFDQDGLTDFFYMGQSTSPLLVFIGPDLKVNCQQAVADFPYPPDGFGLAYGDFNEDGRSDIVFSQRRTLVVRFKNNFVGCAPYFSSTDQMTVALPSTPHDLAVMDVDQDGILDVLCAFDSLATLAVCRGGGVGGVPDGTLLPPITLDTHDVWDIGLGDFVADGTGDVLTSMATCGYVSVWQNSSTPQFPITITLDSPNGGESLSRTPIPAPPSEASAIALVDDESAMVTRPAPATDSAPPAKTASLRTISWTKGAGIHGVDVELSRNDGATWESIGANMPGSSMTWYSTPPASSQARVRVRDAASPGHMDASDAPFAIITGLVGTPPPGAPTAAGLALLGRNPAIGAMRFRLDVPESADVAVVIYDAAGRAVRTLARRNYAAGSYDLGWDGANERGAGARSGVYFVRTTIGSFRATRKIVML